MLMTMVNDTLVGSGGQDTNSGGQQGDTLQGGQGGSGGGNEGNQAAEAEIQRKLTEANHKAATAQVYAQLMQDPDFAAVAQAKAAGKKIKVQFEDSGQPTSLADQLVPPSGQKVD